MAEPIRLAPTLCTSAETDHRPEIGDIVATHVACCGISFRVCGLVVELIRDDETETAVVEDYVGCLWEVPIDCVTVQKRAA